MKRWLARDSAARGIQKCYCLCAVHSQGRSSILALSTSTLADFTAVGSDWLDRQLPLVSASLWSRQLKMWLAREPAPAIATLEGDLSHVTTSYQDNQALSSPFNTNHQQQTRGKSRESLMRLRVTAREACLPASNIAAAGVGNCVSHATDFV